MDETTGGFETRTWGSVVSPYDGRNINRFSDECLRAGQSQKIWFVTSVNTISFKKSTWKNMRCEDFKYVLPTEDEKTSVQLG